MRFALSLLMAASLAVSALGQCVGPYCPVQQAPTCNGPFCQAPVIAQQAPVVINPVDFQLEQMVAAAQQSGPSSAAAVRVSTGGGCGSGSVVGYYKDGSLVLTNAHVAGTRVGRQVTVRAVINGQARDMSATVIMAAYSSKTLTDWAVLYVEGLKEIEPVPLSKDKPAGTHYTTGSPRCVWPLRSTSVITADIADNSPLWRWRPNSIGGQSGSGVWSTKTNFQEGLLTWSWGGLGAGQQTSEIYRQAQGRTTTGAPRIGGLEEVAIPGVIVEDGFFAQTDITTLPIWAGDDIQDPGDDGDNGNSDCDIPEQERRLFNRLRARSSERGVDFLALLELILKLIELLK